MNISSIKKKQSLMLGLSLCLIFNLTACKSYMDRDFNDKIYMSSQTDKYVLAVGEQTIYVVWGKYKNLSAGQCITLSGQVFRYSIAALLAEDFELRTKETVAVAKKQQETLKKEHSLLYNPSLNLTILN